MFEFLAWRIKRALTIIECTGSFLLRYLNHHPSKYEKGKGGEGIMREILHINESNYY